jgi:hypothetical protein
MPREPAAPEDRHMPFTQRIDAAALQPTECSDLRRLGSLHDGGYVVPVQALRRASVLLSLGLAANWNFERDALALNPALAIHAYDHTVGPKYFVKAALRSAVRAPLMLIMLSPRKSMRSLRKLRNSLDYFRFFRGRSRHFAQRVWYNDDRGSADIEAIVTRTGVTAPHSIFAKIDIEGSEYRILPFICDHARLFSGMVIEFHDTDICAATFDAQIAQLRRDFEIVHTHANNYGDLSADHALPLTWELSLLHKDLLGGPARPYTGPLPRPGLDSPNDPQRPDYVPHLTDASAASPHG